MCVCSPHCTPDFAFKGMRLASFPRRSGATVKWQVSSLLSISPGLLGVPFKRVNTSMQKKCVSFLSGPLSNCYSNLYLCVTEPAAAAGERGRGSGPNRAAGGAAAARKPHQGAGQRKHAATYVGSSMAFVVILKGC